MPISKSFSEYVQEEKRPQIYAYTTSYYKDIPWSGQKEGEGKGLIKVGYTARKDIRERIWEQIGTATAKREDVEIIFERDAIADDGEFFTDKEVHKVLTGKGFRRMKGNEWFECSLADLENAFLEVKTGKPADTNIRNDFKMRPEQEQAVELTSNYFQRFRKEHPDKSPHFLWNAKMRFGKTFTTYQLAKKMGWSRVIVLTYKPAVKSAWQEDLETHIDFEGWQFISRGEEVESKQKKLSRSDPVVWFASFQDVLGKDSEGGIKQGNILIHETEWDCVVIDEYHYGAWRESAKDLYDSEKSLQKQLQQEAEIKEEALPLQTKHFLYLSGTPFRAISQGEFTEEEIFNWTYTDEQKAKNDWQGSIQTNPYAELPQMIMMTYQLPEELRVVATTTDQNQFDLNEFFKAEEKEIDGEKYNLFKHPDQVQKWLNSMHGDGRVFSQSYGIDTPPIPFQDVKLLANLSHTFWLLPSVASCKAMRDLLKQPQNNFYNKSYEIIVVAGDEGGGSTKAVETVKECIGKGINTKSITLSCGKLTTGVSIKPWTGIFFLRNTTSPESYFQACFRVQTPWVLKNIDKQNPNKRFILKEKCYVFDFAPNRTLNLISEYSARLDANSDRRAEDRVSEFLEFLPVLCYDGTVMREINATELLDYAATGTAGTMLARKWQSPQLLDISNFTLERVLKSEQVLNALEKIEDFRNIGQDLRRVITSEESINKMKKENPDKKLPEKVKKEEKENKDFKIKLKEKLLKFITRVPVFMYLTDFREETLKDVITKVEQVLFRKVTGLMVNDFDKMCDVGVFNAQNLNSAIFAFRRFEEASLTYAGGRKLNEDDIIGGFNTKLQRKETSEVIEQDLPS